METATVAGGCFWCTEAIFRRLKGVQRVASGYTGGTVENPTYEQVCSGTTGHAEAIAITFDPSIISYKTLLEIFFHLHDPTTKNRQGNDVGTQYRSSIFYHNASQEKEAHEVKEQLEKEKAFTSPIVTEIVPASTFYSAEAYHQEYFEKNSYQGYCQYVIDPKVQKLLAEYRAHVKTEYLQ
jgi:peptide-methionine (S)-S-oxide reductase